MVSVHLQWTDQIPPAGIDIFLFSTVPGTAHGIPHECPDSNSCNVTFDGSYTNTSGDYWLAVEFRGTYNNTTGIVNRGHIFPKSILVSNILVTGDSITRINSTLLKQTFTIGDYRYHRVYFANNDSQMWIKHFCFFNHIVLADVSLVYPESLISPLFTIK